MHGLETYYAAIKPQLTENSAIQLGVALVHFAVLKAAAQDQNELYCVNRVAEDENSPLAGLPQTSKELHEGDRLTELLPEGWKQQLQKGAATFVYVPRDEREFSKSVLIMKIVPMEASGADQQSPTLCVDIWKANLPAGSNTSLNTTSAGNDQNINMDINVADFVDLHAWSSSNSHAYNTIKKDAVNTLTKKLGTEMNSKFFAHNQKTGGASAASGQQRQPPRNDDPPFGGSTVRPRPGVGSGLRDPMNIGSRDLDPFFGTGGNVFPTPGMPSAGGIGGGQPRYFPTAPDDIRSPFSGPFGGGGSGGVGGIGPFGPSGSRSAPNMPGVDPDPDNLDPFQPNRGGIGGLPGGGLPPGGLPPRRGGGGGGGGGTPFGGGFF